MTSIEIKNKFIDDLVLKDKGFVQIRTNDTFTAYMATFENGMFKAFKGIYTEENETIKVDTKYFDEIDKFLDWANDIVANVRQLMLENKEYLICW